MKGERLVPEASGKAVAIAWAGCYLHCEVMQACCWMGTGALLPLHPSSRRNVACTLVLEVLRLL